MSLRPTGAQALAHGICLGGVVGALLAGALLAAHAFGLWWRWGISVWVAVAALLAIGVAVGAVTGALCGRDVGVDADDLGIHPVPHTDGTFLPWQRVVELCAQRRGGRTTVVVLGDTGVVTRLRAPYDSRLFARDPEFERKLFLLRNLWETHRSFNIGSG